MHARALNLHDDAHSLSLAVDSWLSVLQLSACFIPQLQGTAQQRTSHCTMWPRSAMLPHRQRTVVLALTLPGARRPLTALPGLDVPALEPETSLALILQQRRLRNLQQSEHGARQGALLRQLLRRRSPCSLVGLWLAGRPSRPLLCVHLGVRLADKSLCTGPHSGQRLSVAKLSQQQAQGLTCSLALAA